MFSPGRKPAEAGVAGLGMGDLISGSGKDDVLSRASRAFMSRRLVWRFAGPAELITVEPDEDGREGGRFDFGVGSVDLLGSGALVTRPPSFSRRDLVVAGETVCARAILLMVGVFSDITSSIGCGFLACATARGPAQRGNPGTATLASTKLASTLTGKVFSFIFSFLAESPKPNTICWTLLYTLRHVLKASDCGFDERSWRYV